MENTSSRKTAFHALPALFFFTLLVKLFGFLKQAVVAAVFGAAGDTDVFFIASDFYADMSAVFFTPVAAVLLSRYIKCRADFGGRAASAFAASAIGRLLRLCAALCALFFLLARPLAGLLGAGLSSERQSYLAGLLRLLSAGLLSYCLCALLSALLSAHGRFLPAQGRGLIRSAAMMLCVLSLAGHTGAGSLAAGMLLSLLLEAAFMLFCCRKFLVEAKGASADTADILRASSLLMLSAAAAELSHIVDKAIASHLADGAVSALCYAQMLQGLATAVFASNMGAVAHSWLCEREARQGRDKLISGLGEAVGWLLFFVLPASAALALMSRGICSIVYLRGSFDAYALKNTSDALFWYMAGLPALSLQTLFLRGCYAAGNSRLPLISGGVSVAVNIALSAALASRLGPGGIAAASAASYAVGAFIASKIMRGGYKIPHLLKIAAAGATCIFCGAAAYLFLPGSLLWRSAAAGAAVFLSYALVLLLTREKHVIIIIKGISRRRGTKYL